jgi:transglutaminase-like putative cysteine protease
MATTVEKKLKAYLRPTYFIDSLSQEVMEFEKEVSDGAASDIDKAVKLYYAVRDKISYDPYRSKLDPEGLKASSVLKTKIGNCISKAILLAATARAAGIPSRLGFADVRNHLTTEGLKQLLQSDVIRCHGYTELFLEDRWIKATPAFDRILCKLFFDVSPLEFDGRNDSLFQEFNRKGGQFMEYLRDRGQFDDFPYVQIAKTFKKYYPHLVRDNELLNMRGSFKQEALFEKRKTAKN